MSSSLALKWTIDTTRGTLNVGRTMPFTGNTYALSIASSDASTVESTLVAYVMDDDACTCLAKSKDGKIAFNSKELRDSFGQVPHEVRTYHCYVRDGEKTLAEGDISIQWNPLWSDAGDPNAYTMRGTKGDDGDKGDKGDTITEVKVRVIKDGETPTASVKKIAGKDGELQLELDVVQGPVGTIDGNKGNLTIGFSEDQNYSTGRITLNGENHTDSRGCTSININTDRNKTHFGENTLGSDETGGASGSIVTGTRNRLSERSFNVITSGRNNEIDTRGAEGGALVVGSGNTVKASTDQNGTVDGGNVGSLCHGKDNQVFRGKAAVIAGEKCIVRGERSVAHGDRVVIADDAADAHGEGVDTTVEGVASHAEGFRTLAEGNYSHAEGQGADNEHVWLDQVLGARGDASHIEGIENVACGQGSHAEGKQTLALADGAHSEGVGVIAEEDIGNILTAVDNLESIRHTDLKSRGFAIGAHSHSEGENVVAGGRASHAEGKQTLALGANAHTEGICTLAQGNASHAEGIGSDNGDGLPSANVNVAGAGGFGSHIEGERTKTTSGARAAHAEGYNTKADAPYAHAEGESTLASGRASHAQGYRSSAEGSHSFAAGRQAKAKDDFSFVFSGKTDDKTSEASFPSNGEGTATFHLNRAEEDFFINDKPLSEIIETRNGKAYTAKQGEALEKVVAGKTSKAIVSELKAEDAKGSTIPCTSTIPANNNVFFLPQLSFIRGTSDFTEARILVDLPLQSLDGSNVTVRREYVFPIEKGTPRWDYEEELYYFQIPVYQDGKFYKYKAAKGTLALVDGEWQVSIPPMYESYGSSGWKIEEIGGVFKPCTICCSFQSSTYNLPRDVRVDDEGNEVEYINFAQAFSRYRFYRVEIVNNQFVATKYAEALHPIGDEYSARRTLIDATTIDVVLQESTEGVVTDAIVCLPPAEMQEGRTSYTARIQGVEFECKADVQNAFSVRQVSPTTIEVMPFKADVGTGSGTGGGATAPQFHKMNVVPLGSEMLEFSYDGEIESGARLYVEPFKQFDKEVGEWSKEGIVSVGTALCPSVREAFWGDDNGEAQISIRTPGTPADGFIPEILWTGTFNVVNTILEENTGQSENFVVLKIELVQDVVEGPNLEPLYSGEMNLNVVDVEHDNLIYTSSIPITDDLLLNGFSYDDNFYVLGDRILEGTGAWLYGGVNVMVGIYADGPGIDSKKYLSVYAGAQIAGITNWGSDKFVRLRLEKAEALDGETERYKALHEAYNPTKGVLEYVDMGTTVVLKDEEWTLTANTQDWMLEPSSFSIGGVLNINFTHSIVFNGSWTMCQSIEEYDYETKELFPYAEYWYGQGIECRSTVMVNNEKYSSTSDEVQLEWNDVTTRPVVNISRQWVDLRVPCVKNGVTDCTICINAPWDRLEGDAMLYLNIIPDQSDYLCITDDYDDYDYIEMPVVNWINRTVIEIKEVEPKVLSIVRRWKDQSQQ